MMIVRLCEPADSSSEDIIFWHSELVIPEITQWWENAGVFSASFLVRHVEHVPGSTSDSQQHCPRLKDSTLKLYIVLETLSSPTQSHETVEKEPSDEHECITISELDGGPEAEVL
ncbi:hypothetical protein ACJJTC_000443 [Scirpophaga incertulas]